MPWVQVRHRSHGSSNPGLWHRLRAEPPRQAVGERASRIRKEGPGLQQKEAIVLATRAGAPTLGEQEGGAHLQTRLILLTADVRIPASTAHHKMQGSSPRSGSRNSQLTLWVSL